MKDQFHITVIQWRYASYICSQNWICADLGCTTELGSSGTPAMAINSSTLSNCIVRVKFTI